ISDCIHPRQSAGNMQSIQLNFINPKPNHHQTTPSKTHHNLKYNTSQTTIKKSASISDCIHPRQSAGNMQSIQLNFINPKPNHHQTTPSKTHYNLKYNTSQTTIKKSAQISDCIHPRQSAGNIQSIQLNHIAE
ncbi:hypothetical protein O3P16_17985, partial [Chitinophagaceae bacterium LY-5]|nr:hypothetical protein [Chitinophagaceae bacterium LY-5]